MFLKPSTLSVHKKLMIQTIQKSGISGLKIMWSTNKQGMPSRVLRTKQASCYPLKKQNIVAHSDIFSSSNAIFSWSRVVLSTASSLSLVVILYFAIVPQQPLKVGALENISDTLKDTFEKKSEWHYDNGSTSSYQIFDRNEKPTDMQHLLDSFVNADVILIGETHNDAVAHYVELALLNQLFEKTVSSVDGQRPVMLSLEFFNHDVQEIMNAFITGDIDEVEFLQQCPQKPSNIEDYLPLLRYCRANHIPVLASNAPKYIIDLNGKEHLTTLSTEHRKHGIPPVPYPLPSTSYQEKFLSLMNHQLMMAAHGMLLPSSKEDMLSNSLSNMQEWERHLQHYLDAQNLWDASMAYNIVSEIRDNPNRRICHICGKFHMEDGLGIPEHIHNYAPHLKVASVSIVPQEERIWSQERVSSEDFVIHTMESVNDSHRQDKT
eukprot:jgi/Galph1/3467/GphlegSOOS_G2141.1